MTQLKALVLAAGLLLGTLSAMSGLGCTMFGIRGHYPDYAYAVLEREGRFEIRQYEPAIVARTKTTGAYRESGNRGFGVLAGYIFGGNTAREEIAMTSPVLQERAGGARKAKGEKIAMTMPVLQEDTADGWTMSFVMPAEYTMETLPHPNDSRVELEEVPGRTIAAYRYSGLVQAGDLEAYAPRLREWSHDLGYRAVGDPMFARYDPPWTMPFLRRNEVMVEVERAE